MTQIFSIFVFGSGKQSFPSVATEANHERRTSNKNGIFIIYLLFSFRVTMLSIKSNSIYKMNKITLTIFASILISSFVNYKSKIIYIQPLGEVNQECLNYLKTSVKDFYGYDCVVKTKVNLTNDILAESKTRYEASKILNKYNSNQNLLIITEKDIAYKKSDKFPEWGIFGLGLRPGKTCVVSILDLKRKLAHK